MPSLAGAAWDRESTSNSGVEAEVRVLECMVCREVASGVSLAICIGAVEDSKFGENRRLEISPSS